MEKIVNKINTGVLKTLTFCVEPLSLVVNNRETWGLLILGNVYLSSKVSPILVLVPPVRPDQGGRGSGIPIYLISSPWDTNIP